VITLGPADVETYKEDVATSQSNVEVISGERISEAAALEGMIVHSANNLATSLAVWDRGSLGAFVTEMNASAGALGMKRTHYVDASGYEAGSVSSAADLLMIAAADMGDAVFAQMAAMPEANLPVVGVVANVTPLAGTDGVIGVKSGYTSAAGGCDVLAIDPVLGGKPVLILAAVTGQRGPQPGEQAGEAALALSQGVAKTVQAVEWRAGTRVGVVRDGPARVSLVTTGRVSWLVENSDRASAKLVMPKSLIHGEGPGMVGKVTLRSGGREISVAVRLSAVVP
jgi:D-alanyl-D-alanine carboxypeptidase (penicillin-binding protein 5/6)